MRGVEGPFFRFARIFPGLYFGEGRSLAQVMDRLVGK
jgi:hypothetical protein